jgi:hypothetical protein
MSDEPVLVRVQQQVSDREPVDWAAADSAALSLNDSAALELLRVLDGIAHAHLMLQEGVDDPPMTADAPAVAAEASAPAERTVGHWGRYRLDEQVGRGAFGSVWRAWDPELEMPVAIKILHHRAGDAQLQALLLKEGRALAQIRHPNVVRVLNVENHGGELGLVMEYLRGETLDAMVTAQGTLNDREASVIVEDVCRALAAVHAFGFLHRDVKARNILRERAGRIVLMDFGSGLSKQLALMERHAVGTPLYMAPEVLNGQPASIASDVYSVGVLLFYLVTRRYPFEAASLEELEAAHAAGTRASVLELRPDLPLSFTRVVDRALAIDPRQRYASATALMQALLHAREERPGWRRIAARAVLATAAAGGLVTLAGMLTTAAFNLTLRRTAFVQPSVLEWLEYGGRSLFLPFVVALLGVGATGLAAAVRNIFVSTSRHAKHSIAR